ncbi:hypothetical protein C8J25_10937 [Sphingomonas faeni]|uniref:Uncharacterized protein n=1 Tax=Sphingomonas faeni TaxID=185950 RepID=A0A2T5TZD5_9SPHN|nr:hypothetical protein C8J25_10937 [Sphingomonas faeni]
MTSASNTTPAVIVTTPAEAGAQLGNGRLADAALRYLDLSNWAPAFAGVVFSA